MKKKYYIFFIIILLFIIQCKKDYIKTTENYFKYLKNGKIKKAYDLLSLKDKNVISFEEYQKDNLSTPISKNIIKRIKYNIIDSNLSRTKQFAIIKVEIIQPDLVKLYTFLPELLNKKYNEKQINKIFQSNSNIIKNNSLKIVKDYKLVLENNKWFIYADYEKKKYIYNLIKDADEYYEKNNYTKALIKYEKVLDLIKDDKVLNKIRKIKEKLDYIEKYIKISCKILKKSKKGVIIDIAIKNTGTIVLKKVIIDFLFYDNDNVVYKESQQLLDKNQHIGFDNKVRKKVVFEDYKDEYSKIKCVISAIEF